MSVELKRPRELISRITENERLETVSQLVFVPAFIYLMGVFAAGWPSTREVALADDLLVLATLKLGFFNNKTK